MLQIWGGLFYLFNKIFFSFAERSKSEEKRRTWRIASWSVYLIGLPAWFIIFIFERNWIAAALEAGGIPAMFLGLILALRGIEKKPTKWLDYAARITITTGIIYSLYDFKGITTLNQVLEIGIIIGFLMGTYLLAKQKANGYIWFMFMNISCAALMAVEHYPFLVLQQIISLGFVIDAFIACKRRSIVETK